MSPRHDPAGLRETLRDRLVVASVSGGKDSAAMSLYLTELEIPHRRVFCDTGWEHEATYEYLRGPLTAALGPIDEVRGPDTMHSLIRRRGMFPARIHRFCTEELKVEPLRVYLQALDDEYVNAVGIRRAESVARANAVEWEWSEAFQCEVWRPLLHWTEREVIAMHRRHGLAPNPLYRAGATRVGCWPCIFASKRDISLVAALDPERIALIRRMEADVAAARAARFKVRGEEDTRHPPTWFTLRPDGPKHEAAPIDEVVRWAESAAPEPALFDEGCLRWGLCEP